VVLRARVSTTAGIAQILAVSSKEGAVIGAVPSIGQTSIVRLQRLVTNRFHILCKL
jgi:hypothetical protein